MAKVIKEFSGVQDGEVHPKQFKAGDEVTGSLAAIAVSEGWAEADEAPQKHAKK